MIAELEYALATYRADLHALLHSLIGRRQSFLLHTDVVESFEEVVEHSTVGDELRGAKIYELIHSVQEAVIRAPEVYLAFRPRVGSWTYVLFHSEEMHCREVSGSQFLGFKEALVEEAGPEMDHWILELDLRPFERGFPKLKEPRSIGRGVEFLNRHLSAQLFKQQGKGDQRLFDFLRVHHEGGRQLMINQSLRSVEELSAGLEKALRLLDRQSRDAEWPMFESAMRDLGFEAGWGRTVERVRGTMTLLSDLLEAPDPQTLENFLARVPMVFRIVILSPHGYFGQAGVLGMPDTGGQVVYILDQVRALEEQMRNSIREEGLDIEPRIIVLTRLIPDAGETTCNQRLEPILGTNNAQILRVPFREPTGEVVHPWISRFHIWPYLERFAVESEKEILAELGGRPDFIIGNYSDGNLVAALLSRRLGVTQCNIAHALEKTKYLFSGLLWKEHEEEHRFSCQFTADLIAMNTADFIITSTYQEIAGTASTVGQYESYNAFTMPGLYRVLHGIDVYDPKFNIVSPGADERFFFPYTEKERRFEDVRRHIQDLIYGQPDGQTRGRLEVPERPLILAMSRLDPIKNVSGLLRWYAECPELQEVANLCLVGGFIDPEQSAGNEERDQILRMHALLSEHDLDHRVRWLPMQTDKNVVSELYRVAADTRGAFVQPALFEAFGLTVIEAMTSGLPTFATCYGGPLEIIEDEVSGFHLDPNHGADAARRLWKFFVAAEEDPAVWDRLSQGGIQRVRSRYTWKLYADRLLTLSRVYGFWKYISNIEREETRRYLEMFYALMYRPRTERMNGHGA